MAREKPPEAGVPEWILTYGDMMSLLLCFFIMMYALSTLQEPKIQAAIESLREGFGYMGANAVPKDRQANASKPKINSTGRAKRLDVLRGGQPVVAPQGDQAKVQTVRVNEEPITGGLIRFEIGSDELTEDAKKQLQVLYTQLVGSPFKIQVVGHAGATEQGPYRDDFDFSYARAANVMRYLVSLGLKPVFFRITPVGASEPISRTVLPPGTAPAAANAFAEVKLLSNTVRELESDKADRNLKYLNDLPSQ
ncbi:MAG: OmpA family protein [Planctomycetaceae bacterium]|jgi:chemotaxis protein MotB|nr:OmpA family protein [Planctomycetaceae bacterium]